MLNTVFFDLDDTIFDFTACERAALSDTLRFFGAEPTEERLVSYNAINAFHWRLLEKREITRDELRTRRFEVFFRTHGLCLSPSDFASLYEKKLADAHIFMPDAIETLEILASRYRLYAATNGYTATQSRRFALAGLQKYFSGLFISQTVGFDKPAREYFTACFQSIPGFDVSRAVMIGDKLSSDIRGGRDAGLMTVWFNPRGEENAADVRPDFVVSSLSELPALLANL